LEEVNLDDLDKTKKCVEMNMDNLIKIETSEMKFLRLVADTKRRSIDIRQELNTFNLQEKVKE
jgi:hypothetical protein